MTNTHRPVTLAIDGNNHQTVAYFDASLGCWCTRHDGTGKTTQMPAWWSPENRYAWQVVAGNGEVLASGFPSRIVAADHRRLVSERVKRITADLTTGEEVPA